MTRAKGDSQLKLYGIFGHPLAHTISPAIQNRAFDVCGLKSLYFPFERTPARFRFLMRNLKTLLLDGFNVTVPFKETVIPFLGHLTPEARQIGSVNTVKKEGKRWVGHNTDLWGFESGLAERRFNPRDKSVVVLGAGGSARTVVFSLAKKRARTIVIANRTKSRAVRLLRALQYQFPNVSLSATSLRDGKFRQAVSNSDLIVNATKVGLRRRDPLLVPKQLLPKKRALVYDLIYNPRETKLLRVARKCGHHVQNGETMLVEQGAKAFEIWTRQKPPIIQMKRAFRDALDFQ
jgi:shikimate dehydrogenase